MSTDLPNKPTLTAWQPDPAPRSPKGTLTRLLQGHPEAKPLIVVPRLGEWIVILAPGRTSMIEGNFAAPTERLARLYADDYLHAEGFTGPGIGALPAGYPPLRPREDAFVPSKLDRGVSEQGAKCACGYVGVDIMDRHQACPSCGGITVLMSYVLAEYASKLGS